MTKLKVENVEINCRLNMLEQMIESQQKKGQDVGKTAQRVVV